MRSTGRTLFIVEVDAMDAKQRAAFMHGLAESELRWRMEELKRAGKCDSLFIAMLGLQMDTYNESFRVLVEAIEDGEAVK